MNTRIVILGAILLLTPGGILLAASPDAPPAEMAICDACHAEALSPPKGPPYWAIQNRYSRLHRDEAAFVQAIADFVVAPTKEKALMGQAVEHLGLMPAMPLPSTTLDTLAKYIHNTVFPPPCEHWKAGLKIAESQGDEEHAAQERRKLKKFCH